MIIDAYTHALTERFYETLLDDYAFNGLTGDPSFLWDMEQRLTDMDEYGIDKQVLTIALPPLWRGMDRADALELTKLANDEIRRLADEHPDEFVPVGTIPFVDDDFMAEFDRCVEDLDMAGIQIFSTIEGEPLDRPRFDPLFAKADRTDTPLWMHPQLHEWYDWASEYMEHRLFGWPFDTTLALSRLVFAGTTQRHDFDLVSHHGGGMVPFYRGRIDGFYETRQQYPDNYADTELPDFDQPPSEEFASFHADTAVGGSVPAYECAHDLFGDNLVWGTDYPFGPSRGRAGIENELLAVDEMDLGADARENLLAGNLRDLVS